MGRTGARECGDVGRDGMAIVVRGMARGGDDGRAGVRGAARIHGAWMARV